MMDNGKHKVGRVHASSLGFEHQPASEKIAWQCADISLPGK
jgi:hypothetical protein